jgi:hypothetical protein
VSIYGRKTLPKTVESQALTRQQIVALKALDKIHQGNPTTFLNWADADSLVKIGLAEKLAEGKYAINEKGIAALQRVEAEGD